MATWKRWPTLKHRAQHWTREFLGYESRWRRTRRHSQSAAFPCLVLASHKRERFCGSRRFSPPVPALINSLSRSCSALAIWRQEELDSRCTAGPWWSSRSHIGLGKDKRSLEKTMRYDCRSYFGLLTTSRS